MKHTRKRYQQGSLTTEKRKNGEKVWVYRWRELVLEGGTVQRKRIVGTKQQYSTKSAALKAVEGLQLDINAAAVSGGSLTVDQLIEHYKDIELAETNSKTARTKEVYRHQLDKIISPAWGAYRLTDVKPVAVEKWLNAMPVAPGTRYKTKGVLSVLFQHAMRYEWSTSNPIRLVRQSAMPQQEEIVLTPVEVAALLGRASRSIPRSNPACMCNRIEAGRTVRVEVGRC
jgi:integrase